MKHFVVAIIVPMLLSACLGIPRSQPGETNAQRSASAETEVIESSLLKMNKDLKGLTVGLMIPPPPRLLQTVEDIELQYGRIKDAGMNMVWGWEWWDYGERINDILNVCAQVGVDYIMPLPMTRITDEDLETEVNNCLDFAEMFMDRPAIRGFYMVDEPSVDIFNRLAEVRKRVDAILPEGKYTITNLHPYWGIVPGRVPYDYYVDQYMSQVEPKILSFDYYPLTFDQPTENLRDFIKNLLVIRESSFKYNVPFWGYIQAIGYDYHREPSYTEIRWLNNMHILFGAKGYSYFLYSAIGTTGGPQNFTTSALAWDGTTTPLYDMMKSINAEFSVFDRTFIQFTQDGFILVNMEDVFLEGFEGKLLKKKYGRLSSIKTDGTMLNGCFDFKGQKAVYLFNWDMNDPMAASLTFSGRTTYELWGKGGLEASGTGTSLNVTLEAGEGKFLVFKK